MVNRRFKSMRLSAVAAIVLVTAGCDEKRIAPAALPPPAVIVARPVERTVTDHQVFTARTQAVQSVEIKARVTGYLNKILFKDGDEVKAGAVLFEIDDRPYRAALDQAKAALEVAKAALIKAQAEYEIGLSVQKQNPGAISEQQMAARLGTRDEAKANVAQASAQLESAQLNFDWCRVTSPIAGRADRHLVDVGNVVTKDVTSLTNIVSLRPIWAYFDVDQNTAEHSRRLVREGTIKSTRENAIPIQMAIGADSNFAFGGVIDFLSNQLDPNTGSIRVRATFPNTDGSLVAGLFSRIRVPMTGPHPALLVADQAIGTDQSRKFILLIDDKNEVEYRGVEVGQLQSDGLREVLRYRTVAEPGPNGKDVVKQVEVLKPTDRVIVEGLLRVRPGVTVTPKTVDMLTLLAIPGK